MQILIATIMRPTGETGVQTHCNTFLRWLVSQGHDARLITPFDAPRWRILPVFGLRRLVERISKPRSVWWYRHWHAYFLRQESRRRLADGAPCIVYAQCPVSARAAMNARTSMGQRVVMIVHFNVSQADEWVGKGMLAVDHPIYQRIVALELDVLQAVDALVFVSDYMRRVVLARARGARHCESTVIANFVDAHNIVDAPRREHDLINIGTLEPRKNQRYLLEIVAAAQRQGVRLRLTLVGDGPCRGSLEAYAAQLGVSDSITFAGQVSNASRLISSHKAYIHAARIENLPLALVESLAHGTPIFAPPVGGVPEIFDNEVEGRWLPLDDADAAARLVLQWWRDPSQLQAASRAARSRFERCFDTRVLASRLVTFLEDPHPKHVVPTHDQVTA